MFPIRGGPLLSDLLGGQVQISFLDIGFLDIGTSIEHVRSGNLRAIAVTTANRSEALPDVPAVGETI
jgi:tripartite-type tricarboxylate transporter receptor subunit TctC